MPLKATIQQAKGFALAMMKMAFAGELEVFVDLHWSADYVERGERASVLAAVASALNGAIGRRLKIPITSNGD